MLNFCSFQIFKKYSVHPSTERSALLTRVPIELNLLPSSDEIPNTTKLQQARLKKLIIIKTQEKKEKEDKKLMDSYSVINQTLHFKKVN